MIPLIQLNGANPVTQFDNALDAAHVRVVNNGQLDEPYFVRELITDTTIRALNTAAANSYDENFNIVRFRGGFLHGRPWAVFDAEDNAGNKKTGCRRELADALLVFHLTEQDGTGAHKIVRRAACLLMFKTSDHVPPNTPSYVPLGASLPSGTDQEQFYLFNQWPPFDLTTSAKTKIKGKGNYALNSNGNFNIGKYALLWDAHSMPPLWPQRWRYADPVASLQVIDSLGSLLAKLVDSHPTVGESFDPAGASDWDHLLEDLLQYTETRFWKGSRSANPAELSFLSQFETTIASIGTCMQHARLELPFPDRLHLLRHHFPLSHYKSMHSGYSHPTNETEEEGIPVIFASASSFKSPERGEAPSLQARQNAFFDALRSLS